MVLGNWVLSYVGYKWRTGRSGPKQVRRDETDCRPDVFLAEALRKLCKEFPQNIALNRTSSTRRYAGACPAVYGDTSQRPNWAVDGLQESKDWPLYPASEPSTSLGQHVDVDNADIPTTQITSTGTLRKFCARTASDMTVLKLQLVATSYKPAIPQLRWQADCTQHNNLKYSEPSQRTPRVGAAFWFRLSSPRLWPQLRWRWRKQLTAFVGAWTGTQHAARRLSAKRTIVIATTTTTTTTRAGTCTATTTCSSRRRRRGSGGISQSQKANIATCWLLSHCSSFTTATYISISVTSSFPGCHFQFNGLPDILLNSFPARCCTFFHSLLAPMWKKKKESEIIKTQFHSNSLSFRNFSGGALELLTVKLECNVSIKDGCNNWMLLFLPCNVAQHGRHLPTFQRILQPPWSGLMTRLLGDDGK